MRYSQSDANQKLNEARLVSLRTIEERDERIAQLETQLKEANKPRNRVVLIGGPSDGDIQLVATDREMYVHVLVPGFRERVQDYSLGGVASLQVQTALYRITRVQTADGARYIGLFEGIR